jgi:hypothetical protein
MRQWNSDAKLKLSESFRFGKSIAQIANTILKSYPEGNPRITGTRDQDYLNYPPKNTPQNTTYIARTNSTLFEKAIELQTRGIKCHFVNTEESEGWDPTIPYKLADLKDVYRLWSGNPKGIENPVIKLFKNYHELRKLALGGTQNNKNPKTTGGDKELEYLCRMVEKYKHQLPTLVQLIKDQACGPPQDPQDKVAILCTAHRSKGLEWENVEIANDFLEIQEIEKNLPEYKELTKDDQEYQSFIEEINLLYVACTRAKSNLYLNKDLLKVCIKHQIPLSQPKEMIEEDEVLHKAIAQETDPAIPAIPTIPAIPAIPTIPNSIHKINKDTNNPHHNNSHHSTTLYLTL